MVFSDATRRIAIEPGRGEDRPSPEAGAAVLPLAPLGGPLIDVCLEKQ